MLPASAPLTPPLASTACPLAGPVAQPAATPLAMPVAASPAMEFLQTPGSAVQLQEAAQLRGGELKDAER